MLNKVISFLKIPGFSNPDNKDKGKADKKEDKKTAASKLFLDILEVKKSNVKDFFQDNSLTNSLRAFSKQVSELTSNIMNSKLNRLQKKETLKTAIEGLKAAVEGREKLLEKMDNVQKAKLLFLHGKTVEGLKKSVAKTKEQIKKLEADLVTLEKPVPSPWNVNNIVKRALDPNHAGQMKTVIPVLAMSYGVVKSSKALESALFEKIMNASPKEKGSEIKKAQEFIANYLITIHPKEFEEKEKIEAFTKLVLSIYKHPQATQSDTLLKACKQFFGEEKFEALLKASQSIEGVDKQSLARLSKHAVSVKSEIAVNPNPRESISLNGKLEAVAKNSSPAAIQEIAEILHQDSIEDIASFKDYDIFDPALSVSTKIPENVTLKMRLFMVEPGITLTERARRVEVCIDIAQELIKKNNISLGSAIITTIYTTSLGSVTISDKHRAVMEKYASLPSPIGRFKAHNEHIKNIKGFFIPLPNIKLNDVTFGLDGVKKTTPSLFTLGKLGQIRDEFFMLREEARKIPITSRQTFKDKDERNVSQEVKSKAEKAGFKAPSRNVKTEAYFNYLNDLISKEVKAAPPKA